MGAGGSEREGEGALEIGEKAKSRSHTCLRNVADLDIFLKAIGSHGRVFTKQAV